MVKLWINGGRQYQIVQIVYKTQYIILKLYMYFANFFYAMLKCVVNCRCINFTNVACTSHKGKSILLESISGPFQKQALFCWVKLIFSLCIRKHVRQPIRSSVMFNVCYNIIIVTCDLLWVLPLQNCRSSTWLGSWYCRCFGWCYWSWGPWQYSWG